VAVMQQNAHTSAFAVPDLSSPTHVSGSATSSPTTFPMHSQSAANTWADTCRGKYGGLVDICKLREDYRCRLPTSMSRFLGYRSPSTLPPYEPLPIAPFTWLHKLELRYETWLFAWIGAFGSFLLLGAVMSTSTVFQDVYQHPINLGIFSIFAVLVFGVSESPFAQPRKLIPGYFFSTFVSMAVTRVLAFKLAYRNHSEKIFFSSSFGNVDLPLAMSVFAHFVLGTGNSV
jgi:hypothetical protein